jgi:hypothetical protein
MIVLRADPSETPPQQPHLQYDHREFAPRSPVARPDRWTALSRTPMRPERPTRRRHLAQRPVQVGSALPAGGVRPARVWMNRNSLASRQGTVLDNVRPAAYLRIAITSRTARSDHFPGHSTQMG